MKALRSPASVNRKYRHHVKKKALLFTGNKDRLFTSGKVIVGRLLGKKNKSMKLLESYHDLLIKRQKIKTGPCTFVQILTSSR